MADNLLQKDTVLIEIKAKIDASLKTAIDAVASANKEFSAAARSLKQSADAGRITTDQMKSALTELGSALGKGTGSFREVSKVAAETERNLAKFGSQGLDVAGQAVIKLSRDMQEGMKRIATVSATGNQAMKGFQDMIRGQIAAAETLPARLKLAEDAMRRLEQANKRGSAEWLVYAANVNRMKDEMAKLDAASKGSVNSFKNVRFAAQNVGYQIQDMAVQLQMGTRASIIFTQQMPQLLSGFALMGGKFGAIAGGMGLAAVALGVVFGPMIDKMMASLSPMAKFKAATDEMKKSTEEFESKITQLDFKPFIEQLFSMEKAAAQAFNIFKSFDLTSIQAAAEKAAQAAVDAINSQVAGWNPWRMLTGFMGMGQEIDAIADKFGLAKDQAEWLARSMAKGPEQLAKDAPAIASTLDNTNEKNRELAKLLENVVKAWERSGQAAKDSAKQQLIATAMATKAAADIKAAYADEAQVSVEKLRLQKLEKQGLEANYTAMRKAGELSAEEYRKLMGTEAAYKKSIKDRLQMLEEWSKLMGKTDPEIAFKKASAEATKLAKELGKGPEELAKVIAYLETVRDKAKDAALEVALIKEYASNWGISEESVKSILRIGDASQEVTDKLKVMRLFQGEGLVEDANKIADSLDLKLLPSAERAASAFRRLGAESDLATKQADYNAWRQTADGLEATAEQAIAVADALKVIPSNMDRFNAALSKLRDQDTGFAKLNKDLDEFVVKMGLSAEEAKRLKAALGVKDEINGWEDLSVAIASNMGNAVNQLIDSFGKAKVSFGDMAAAMLKDIAKLIVQLLIMKPLMDSIKGYFGVSAVKSAHGNAFGGATGLPHGVYTRPTFFPMGAGNNVVPFARGGTVGVLAEAGRAEAILPLERDRNGDLGVKGSPMVVNIQNNFAQEVQVTAAKNQQPDGQVVLDIMVERKVRQMVANGSLDNQFRGAYGLTRQPA